jgi:tetratricopeptide (TPR) repeat protein
MLAALLTLALAEAAALGCAGSPRRAPAEALRRQEEGVRAAGRAHAKGDLRGAIAAQERALLAARTVEDEEGIALRILDLAALRRAAGEPREALAALDELLTEPPPLAYPARWRAVAARLAGLLALDDDDADAGRRWATRALELCRRAKCPDEGAILNLQARAAFLAGDYEGAARLAKKALPLNRVARDEAEQANSSRIAGDAQLGSGRHAAAARAYAAALALDKRLGLDGKVFLDLLGLGKAARGGGRTLEARGYLERARAVARAAGDKSGAEEADSLLEALPDPVISRSNASP